MARKPPRGGRPGPDADAPSAAEVEAAIEKALDALRPRAPASRRVEPGKKAGKGEPGGGRRGGR